MIAVVVLTYRAPAAMLQRCVDSAVASGDAGLVIVVDNGQTVANSAIPHGVQLLTTPHNVGYAGGMNVGIRAALAAGADAVALLNDDAVVSTGWLAGLIPRLRQPAASGLRVGAVQPKLVFADGRIQSLGVRLRANGAGVDVGFGEVDTGQYDDLDEIEAFTGGAVVLAGDFLRAVGGFDERYFLYYEDVDLARRGTEAGWTFRVAPDVVVRHDMGATATKMPESRRYWQERNRLWCLFRHGSPGEIGRGLVLSLARLAKTRRRSQLRAIVDGARKAPALLRERRRPVTFDVV